MKLAGAIRAIALFEAAKGLLALCAASGLLLLLHRDLQALALQLVEHLHLNPASRYPQIFVAAAARLHDTRLVLLAVGAAAYALVRCVEAYGLWWQRPWAEMLAAASGALYVPLEVVELLRNPNAIGWAVLLLNLAVVAVTWRAWRQRHAGVTR